MKFLGRMVLAAVVGMVVQVAPAGAESNDWWKDAMRESRGGGTAGNRAATANDGSRPQNRSAARPGGESGVASYYWQPQRLASGGRYNPNALTAAHKTLPLGTRVRVTRVDNGNSVDVTINDRGPYVAGRVIDLSRRAAQDIGMTGRGLARVRVAVLSR